ncbi:hypothetical protein TBK1r_33040 [Stieleria magnilauensis]|uniref:Transposase n=1 Tax=Stieleria magnilauensis TaxID=2527963 RepID=A0ABX5XQS7_9BACT|nr:hypothetical protein TBK1r_33040 [Planctomycetes bacterium TBK1r]
MHLNGHRQTELREALILIEIRLSLKETLVHVLALHFGIATLYRMLKHSYFLTKAIVPTSRLLPTRISTI